MAAVVGERHTQWWGVGSDVSASEWSVHNSDLLLRTLPVSKSFPFPSIAVEAPDFVKGSTPCGLVLEKRGGGRLQEPGWCGMPYAKKGRLPVLGKFHTKSACRCSEVPLWKTWTHHFEKPRAPPTCTFSVGPIHVQDVRTE